MHQFFLPFNITLNQFARFQILSLINFLIWQIGLKQRNVGSSPPFPPPTIAHVIKHNVPFDFSPQWNILISYIFSQGNADVLIDCVTTYKHVQMIWYLYF